MLLAAFVILGAAVLLGSVLAVLHLRSSGAAGPASAGVLHGLLAVVGFICLLLALRGPPRGLETGTSAFGLIAAALTALAALAGGALFAARLLRKRLSGLLIGLHATLAISGFVILAAYVLAG